MRKIDGKYHAEIRQPVHSPTCNKNLGATACNCYSGHLPPTVVIVNTETGAVIPEDEPLILFRGKDVHARATVEHYRHLCYESRTRPEHLAGIGREIKKLAKFAELNPERMKVPD